jgi:hypothetical protein
MRCAHFLAWVTFAEGVERRAHPDVGDRRHRTDVSYECEQVAAPLRRREIDAAERPTGRFEWASTIGRFATAALLAAGVVGLGTVASALTIRSAR